MKERSVIVTGAASGMGRATALKLADQGYAVAALDRDQEELNTTIRLLERAGVPALGLQVDVSDRAAVEQAIARASSELGPVWALAAAAGILQGQFAIDADDDHFERIFRVNVLGVIHANVAAARAMIAAGHGGRIVNWSSRGAVGGAPGYSAYGLSKAAVSSFSQSFALEVADEGITVNAILPGGVRTPMVGYVQGDWAANEAAKVPIGRWGDPEDVAALAAFLTTDDSAWITGAAFTVDGGATAAHGRPAAKQTRARLEAEADYLREERRGLP
jgi:2-hydroxycyclohexanecarboxyl-CoA dehydrogenase